MICLDMYNTRRDLIAMREATTDPAKRMRVNTLLTQLEDFDTAEEHRKPALRAAIEKSMAGL